MQTFVVKLASGVAAMIASVCLSICNLSDSTEQTVVTEAAASSVFGLRMTMTVLPIIGLLVAIVIFAKKYILDEQNVEEITRKLHAEEK
jgi:melibiose permease